MKGTRGREHITVVTVEFEDVDSYGIAHHTKLVAYLERARLRFLRSLGVELFGGPAVGVLYDLRMRFARPVRMFDQLEVAVFVEAVSDFRLDLGYRIRRGGEAIARATTSIAFADLAQGILVAAPAAYVEALAACLGQEHNPPA
jgi:YbgC/YbaW family acyl-CoA thioester hydrolase